MEDNKKQHQTPEEAYITFAENHRKLREQFRVKRKATKEDCKLFPGIKKGDTIPQDPEYKTSREAYELLTKYYAVAYLEFEKFRFVEIYKTWNDGTIKAEIGEIEKVIQAANNLPYKEACEACNKQEDKPEYVYLRLKNGYYENLEVEKYPFINSIGNEEARTYGRYFLFYDYLKGLLTKGQENKGEFTPQPFEKIFNNPTLINECLQLLKDPDKPFINDENKPINANSLKGVFIVWFAAIERKAMFNCTFSNDAERAATLNYNFPGLNVSSSLFRQGNVNANRDYKNYFSSQIAAIKC